MSTQGRQTSLPIVHRVKIFLQVLFHSIFMAIHEFLIWVPGFTRVYLFTRDLFYDKRPPKDYTIIDLDHFSIPNPGEDINLLTDKGGLRIVKGSPLITSIKSREKLENIDIDDLEISIADNGIRIHVGNNYLIIKLGVSNSTDNWNEINIEHNFQQIYGLAEKFGPLDKRGKIWKFWNNDKTEMEIRDDPLYKSYPIAFIKGTSNWFSLIVDYPGYQKWDLTNDKKIQIDLRGDTFTLDICVAMDPHQLMRQISSLLGLMELPPRWSLGFHQCRWSYNTAEKIREIAHGFRSREIPCDVLYLDIDYMDDFKIFTWDEDDFGDLSALLENIHDVGFKVITMVDPGIKSEENYSIYEEAVANNYVLQKKNGNNFQGIVWPGRCVFPDFFNPAVKSWWGNLYQEFVNFGVDGFWNDMNEPTVFSLRGTIPDDICHNVEGKPVEHQLVHNLYGQKMAQASYDGIKSINGNRRFFLLSRAAYLGSQKFGWIWTGDNKSSWDHLKASIPKILNSGLSGHFASGADIGGFREIPSPELFARWLILGTFYPFMRNHTIKFSDDQEPWTFGEKVTAIAQKFIKLRYKLLPYTYTYFRTGCSTGIPLMRPMWMEFPEDENTYDQSVVNTQFMFGSDLLVAPILEKGETRRSVYLPEGKWFDYFSKAEYVGGQSIEFVAELDEIILLVKNNSIIPVYHEVGNNVSETIQGGIDLVSFGNNPTGILYNDDGITWNYTEGEYGLYQINPDKSLILIEGNGYSPIINN